MLEGAAEPQTVRLSEILGALSHALDLTEGQPVGHCVRATWIGFHVGRHMGLPELQLWELYHTVMLKDLAAPAMRHASANSISRTISASSVISRL